MELLLYDRIVVPTPMDRHGPDWKRWDGQHWDPDKLIKTVDQLKKTGNVFESEWDLDRQKEWKQVFEEAKADIQKINDEIKREMAAKAAAYAATRSVQIKHLSA